MSFSFRNLFSHDQPTDALPAAAGQASEWPGAMGKGSDQAVAQGPFGGAFSNQTSEGPLAPGTAPESAGLGRPFVPTPLPTDRGTFEALFSGQGSGGRAAPAEGPKTRLTVREILPFLPPSLVSPGAVPLDREFEIGLAAGGGRAVKLSALQAACPEIFASEIHSRNDAVVTLPPPGLGSPPLDRAVRSEDRTPGVPAWGPGASPVSGQQGWTPDPQAARGAAAGTGVDPASAPGPVGRPAGAGVPATGGGNPFAAQAPVAVPPVGRTGAAAIGNPFSASASELKPARAEPAAEAQPAGFSDPTVGFPDSRGAASPFGAFGAAPVPANQEMAGASPWPATAWPGNPWQSQPAANPGRPEPVSPWGGDRSPVGPPVPSGGPSAPALSEPVAWEAVGPESAGMKAAVATVVPQASPWANASPGGREGSQPFGSFSAPLLPEASSPFEGPSGTDVAPGPPAAAAFPSPWKPLGEPPLPPLVGAAPSQPAVAPPVAPATPADAAERGGAPLATPKPAAARPAGFEFSALWKQGEKPRESEAAPAIPGAISPPPAPVVAPGPAETVSTLWAFDGSTDLAASRLEAPSAATPADRLAEPTRRAGGFQLDLPESAFGSPDQDRRAPEPAPIAAPAAGSPAVDRVNASAGWPADGPPLRGGLESPKREEPRNPPGFEPIGTAEASGPATDSVPESGTGTLLFTVAELLRPLAKGAGLDLARIPPGAKVRLPLVLIEPQMATGAVSVTLKELIRHADAGVGESLPGADPGLSVPLPQNELYHQISDLVPDWEPVSDEELEAQFSTLFASEAAADAALGWTAESGESVAEETAAAAESPAPHEPVEAAPIANPPTASRPTLEIEGALPVPVRIGEAPITAPEKPVKKPVDVAPTVNPPSQPTPQPVQNPPIEGNLFQAKGKAPSYSDPFAPLPRKKAGEKPSESREEPAGPARPEEPSPPVEAGEETDTSFFDDLNAFSISAIPAILGDGSGEEPAEDEEVDASAAFPTGESLNWGFSGFASLEDLEPAAPARKAVPKPLPKPPKVSVSIEQKPARLSAKAGFFEELEAHAQKVPSPAPAVPATPSPAVATPPAEIPFPAAAAQAAAPATAPAPPVAPAPLPVPSRGAVSSLRDIELRAVFGTDEAFTYRRVADLAAGLPGIEACSIIAPGCSVQSPRGRGAGDLAVQAGALLNGVREIARITGMPNAETFTLHTEQGLVSIFLKGDYCLTVRHQVGQFDPGVREKLILVTRGLSGLSE